MQIESLSCNNCGGPLDVPASANFVTCGFCGSRLAINRTGNAHYTEVLERLEQQTARLASDVAYLRLRDDLETVHAGWQRERRRFLVRRRDGTFQAPTKRYLISNVAVVVIFWVLTAWWIAATTQAGPGASCFGWIGVLIAVLTLANLARVYSRVKSYNEVKEEYNRERREILERMNQAQGVISHSTARNDLPGLPESPRKEQTSDQHP